MEQVLAEQIRYLELRRAECDARPALHTRQIAAYDRQLALARAESTGLGYLRRMIDAGVSMEVARAEWIDRYRNWGDIYQVLGDEVRMRTAAANRQVAEQVADGAGLMLALATVKAGNALAEHAADANLGFVRCLMSALLSWRVAATEVSRSVHARAVAALWTSIRGNDPACTWERVCSYPPYRARLPFAAPQLDVVGGWLRQVVGADADTPGPTESHHPLVSAPPDSPAGSLAPAIPSATEAARGYHATYELLDRADPINAPLCRLYERVFELEQAAASGPAFLRAMAEDDMYCRLARAPQLALVERGLARCRGRSQPHAEHHFRELEQALAACRSPTEVEYEVERASRMFAVEVGWNDILLDFAARPIAAVSQFLADPDEPHRRVVAACAEVTRELFGRDWDELLAVPRMWELFCEVWFPRGRSLAPDTDTGEPGESGPRWGAHFGELGTATVAPLREASIQRFIEKSAEIRRLAPDDDADAERRVDELRTGPLFETPEELRDYLSAGVRWALVGDAEAADAGDIASAKDLDPAPASPELALWGHPVALSELHLRLRAPHRPAVTPTGARFDSRPTGA